jgi:hypothetical protein
MTAAKPRSSTDIPMSAREIVDGRTRIPEAARPLVHEMDEISPVREHSN